MPYQYLRCAVRPYVVILGTAILSTWYQMYGSPHQEAENRIYKTNNQTGNSSFPFLSLSQWTLQKNHPQQPRSLFFTLRYCFYCPGHKINQLLQMSGEKNGGQQTLLLLTHSILCCFSAGTQKKGQSKEKRSYLLSVSGFTDPNLVSTELQGFVYHMVKIFRAQIKSLSARNLTSRFPNENVRGCYDVTNDIYLLFQISIMSSQKFYHHQLIFSVSIISVNGRKILLLTLNSFVLNYQQFRM